METPAALIAAFPPSANFLLDRLRGEIDDELLWKIAVADYGQMADEMMVELRQIRDTGVVPTPMPWMLSEVLSLTSYSDPDSLHVSRSEPQTKGRCGHQNRLFVCTVMLISEAESPHGVFSATLHSTLAAFLISAKVLGEEMSEAAGSLLTWCISQEESASDSMLYLSDPLDYAFGLLILAIYLRSERFSEFILGKIADWVLALESIYQQRHVVGFSELLAELRAEVETICNDEVRTNIQLCLLLIDYDY